MKSFTIETNGILSFVARWTDPEDVGSGISQAQEASTAGSHPLVEVRKVILRKPGVE